MTKFFTFRDHRPSGKAHSVRLDRIISVSAVEPLNGFWQFYAIVDSGVEMSYYWCATEHRDLIKEWRAELMKDLSDA